MKLSQWRFCTQSTATGCPEKWQRTKPDGAQEAFGEHCQAHYVILWGVLCRTRMNSVIPMGPFHLSIFHDTMILGLGKFSLESMPLMKEMPHNEKPTVQPRPTSRQSPTIQYALRTRKKNKITPPQFRDENTTAYVSIKPTHFVQKQTEKDSQLISILRYFPLIFKSASDFTTPVLSRSNHNHEEHYLIIRPLHCKSPKPPFN